MIKNILIKLEIISPPYSNKNIQHFFQFVYTFFKKYDKIYKVNKNKEENNGI